jgi:3-hydroxybutyryl-CoA dehydrogenase
VLRSTVVGAGLMGHGIAQVVACAGWPVTLYDPSEDALAAARSRVRANLADLDLDPAIADTIRLEPDLAAAVRDAEFVTEAAPEDLELKRSLFAQLSRLTGPDTILASNTSVISIGAIGADALDPGRVIGTHWWNPPVIVPLVEVIQADATRPAVVERTIAALTALGKLPVHVKRDVPGFVGNRLQHALWREAFALIDAGVCDPETIDLVITHGLGSRLPVIGPVEGADLVGLDLTLAIHRYLLPALDASTTPSTTLEAHVAAGELGMKTGHGFLAHEPGAAEATRTRLIRHLRTVFERTGDAG